MKVTIRPHATGASRADEAEQCGIAITVRGAACRPCELGCYTCPPPQAMRPITCPSCGRVWRKADVAASRVIDAMREAE